MFAAGAPFRKKPTSLAALGNQHDVNGRLDFPYHEQVLNFQASTLAQLLNPFRLARISDGEMKYGAGSMVSSPDNCFFSPPLMRTADAIASPEIARSHDRW